MSLLQITNNIIRSVYFDNLFWKALSDGFIASTHIPDQEIAVIHSVNLLNQFLKNPELENKFKIFRSQARQGQIIHITADRTTSEKMRESQVTGLKGIMIKEHAHLADALIKTRSLTQAYLHIEFPELTKLKDQADPAFLDTIQALVHNACWFRLSLSPTVHVRDTKRPGELLGQQINNLGLFNPVRAQYAEHIVSVTNAPVENTTNKISITPSSDTKEEKSIVLRDNGKLKI